MDSEPKVPARWRRHAEMLEEWHARMHGWTSVPHTCDGNDDEYRSAGTGRWRSVDGMHWLFAPRPPRLHRCIPWSQRFVSYFDTEQRCPCGGRRIVEARPGFRARHPRWRKRNSMQKFTWTDTGRY